MFQLLNNEAKLCIVRCKSDDQPAQLMTQMSEKQLRFMHHAIHLQFSILPPEIDFHIIIGIDRTPHPENSKFIGFILDHFFDRFCCRRR